MSDLICRKTLMRCQTPGMCAPYGGCTPQPVAESVFKADHAALETELAELKAERDTLRTANQRLEGEVNRLRLALTLAANRLDRLTLELPGGYWREESAEWTSQARAALSTNGEVTE